MSELALSVSFEYLYVMGLEPLEIITLIVTVRG